MAEAFSALAGTERTRAAEPLELEFLHGWEGLGGDWDDLVALSGNVFSTRAWLDCWWEHFGAGRKRVVVCVRERDGRLVAVAPLYLRSRLPLRVLRFVGHRGAGAVSPACAPANVGRAADALRRALPRVGADLLLADALPAEQRWSSSLGGRVVTTIPAPTLALAPTWEQQRRRFSGNLRQELGRKERRLERERGLAYRLVTEPGEAADAFETFLRLHRSRWGERTTFADPAFVAFQRTFAAAAARAGRLRIWLLELDGEPAAAWYGFRFGGVETYYQAGRDGGAGAASLGTVLLGRTIRAAVEDGMTEYRFGPGGGFYKYRFADRRSVLETVAVPRGAGAAAAVAAVSGARRLRPLRTLVRRVGR